MALEIGVEATIEGLSSFRRGIGSMEGDVRGFGRTTDSIIPGLDRMGSSLLKIGGIAAGAVVAGLAAASAGVVAFTKGGIDSAIEMEDQMGNIAAVMNTTKDAIQPLSDLILELGIDPGLKVTAEEAAQAIELLARNGLTMQEILDGAARSTVLLANATGAEFGNAADIATDAMAIFGIEAENMEGAVDSIVSVTTNSKFTIDDFSLALRNGGAAAAQLGISLEDFNTVIAATAEEMGTGMRAGTGFRNFITRLTPNSEKAAEAMQELGLITADGSNAFFDAQGNLKEMAEVSGILQDALEDLTLQERSTFLEMIFGQEALGTAIGLANEGEEGFRALAESMSETDAQAAALERMDSVAGVMEILGGVIETVQLQIGNAFLPMLKDLVGSLLEFAERVGPNVVLIFESLAGAISGIGGADTGSLTGLLTSIEEFIGLVSIFAQLTRATKDPVESFFTTLLAAGVPKETIGQIRDFGQSIQEFVDPIIEFVSKHAEAFRGALAGIGAVLGTGVIVSVLTTVGGLLAALVTPIGLLVGAAIALGAAWQSNFGNIQGITFSVIETIQGLINLFQEEGLLGAIMTLTESWNINWTQIQAVIMTAWETIQSVIAAAVAVIQPAIDKFVVNASEGMGSLSPILGSLQELWVALQPIITTVLAIAGAAILAFVGVVVGMVNGVSQAIRPLITTFSFVVNGIITALTGVAEFITGFVQIIIALFQGNSEAVQEAWQKMGAGVTKIVTGLIEAVVGGITGLVSTLIELVSGLVIGIVDFFQGLYDDLVGNSIITDLVNDIINLFLDLASDLLDSVSTMVDDLISMIVTFAGDMIDKFITMVNDIVNLFEQRDWGALGQAIIDGLITAIVNGADAVADAVRGMAQNAIDAATGIFQTDSPSKVFHQIGLDVAQGFINAIDASAGSVQEAVQGMFDFAGVLSGLGSSAAGMLKDQVFPEMEKAIADRERILEALKRRFVGEFGETLGIPGTDDLTQQRLVSAYFQAIHSGNDQMKNDILQIWQAQNQLVQSTHEYEQAQKDILALQKAQQDLAFLEQQTKLLDLIQEHGLDPSAILGGLELGIDADAQGLVQAMTRAIQAIIQQAEDELDIGSPSGVFKAIGKFITRGLAHGIDQTVTEPARAMENMLTRMVQPMQSLPMQPAVIHQPSTTTISRTAQVQFGDVSVNNDMDMQVLGEFIVQKVAEAL